MERSSCLKGKIVKFCWIPSHIGILGNNEAVKPVKSAPQLVVVKFKIPYTDKIFHKVLCKLSLSDIFGTFMIKVNFILIKTK